jgi:hypothetical protein
VRRALEQPLRGLDMHSLDHLVVKPLGAAAECVNQPPCAIELGCPGRECTMARRDLIRMD